MSLRALEHVDKLVLGAATLALVLTAKGAATAPPGAAAARDYEAALTVIEDHAAARPPIALGPAPRWADEARTRLSAEGVPAAAALPAWVMQRRPVLVFDAVPPPPPPDFVHEPSTDVKAIAEEPGRVVVTWTPGRVEELVVTWVVERRRPDGEWTPVGEVPAPAGELIDATAAPRRRLAYRVVGLAAVDEQDARVRRARQAGTFTDLAPALARTESEPSAEVVTPTDLHVVPRSVSDGLTAHGELVRWDPAARAWTRQRFGGRVGEQIAPGVVLEEAGVDRSVLWVRVRLATGEVLLEDSRRERLPAGAR